ncbi:MAG: serine acetyltransferase, partial [Treponema sp.]|nr:serine acetyltransferase [Treponema sp.]
MNRLDRSIDALMESYGAYGIVNHTGGANLPNSEAIEQILKGLESLIFPGFRENIRLDHNDLRL